MKNMLLHGNEKSVESTCRDQTSQSLIQLIIADSIVNWEKQKIYAALWQSVGRKGFSSY